MILFYKNGNMLKIHNPGVNTETYELPSVSSVLATEDDLLRVTTTSSSIVQPKIITPTNNSVGYEGDIVLSPYAPASTFNGVQDAVSIKIALDSEFENIVVLQKIPSTSNLITMLMDYSDKDLFIQVKYHSGEYSSVWSDVVKTRTLVFGVKKPVILGPVTGSENMSVYPMISVNEFSYVGIVDTHESTTYQISEDVNFTSMVYNVTTYNDLLNHMVTEDLKSGKKNYIRVRFNGVKYGNSPWSDIINITTEIAEEQIILMSLNHPNAEVSLYKAIPNEYDENLYFIGLATNPITTTASAIGVGTPIIVKTDKNFNVLALANINVNNDTTVGRNVFDGFYDGKYFYATLEDTTIVKLDNNLNIVKHVSFANQITSTYGVVVIGDEVFVTGGIAVNVSTTPSYVYTIEFVLLKLTTDLVLTDAITLEKTYNGDTYISINILDNYIYLVLGSMTDATKMAANVSVIKLNTTLNIIKKSSVRTNETGNSLRGLFIDSDENILAIMGTTDIIKWDKNLIYQNHATVQTVNLGASIDTICEIDNKYYLTGFAGKYFSPGTILCVDKNLNMVNGSGFTALGNQQTGEYNIARAFTPYRDKVLLTGFHGKKALMLVVDPDLNTRYNANNFTITNYPYTVNVPKHVLHVYTSPYVSRNIKNGLSPKVVSVTKYNNYSLSVSKVNI